jgi:hypothetical protein
LLYLFLRDFINKLPTNTNGYDRGVYWVSNVVNVQLKTPSIFYMHILSPQYSTPIKFYKYLPYTNDFGNAYNIYFIRKEVFYTKLKYSRVPQFDTSSGASASFLSGFYGFLVCEKFGFELIDSGDFFFLTLYVILYAFLLTAVTQIFNHTSNLTVSFFSIMRSFK